MKSMRDMINLMEGARPGTYEVPAVMRKQQGQAPLTPQDVQRHDTEGRISHPDTLAKNIRNLPKESASPLEENLPSSNVSELARLYDMGEISFEEFRSKLDDLEYTSNSQQQGEMGWQGNDTPAGNRAFDQEQGDWNQLDEPFDDEPELAEKSTSQKQARFMAACAHGADYDSCPSDDISQEFNRADTETKQLSKAMKNRESVGMEEAHVDSCKQSNGDPARNACAMEETEPTEYYDQVVEDALAKFENMVMNYYVDPDVAYEKILEGLSEYGPEIVSQFNSALNEIGDQARDESEQENFQVDEDINNGYYDRHFARGVDYFPSGADSSVVDRTGAAGARHGDNPEQKKMAVVETHKELVYKYRAFLKESASK